MQSDFEVLRAKRVFIVLFSERVVLYRQPREPVIFFRRVFRTMTYTI